MREQKAMSGKKSSTKEPRVEVVWRAQPSPQAILRAQLALLGWGEGEIGRAVEQWRGHDSMKRHAP
jgi:hypothetical protein